jgi:hypothetical protein
MGRLSPDELPLGDPLSGACPVKPLLGELFPLLPRPPRFDGVVYDPAFDDDRLRKQLGRVWACMRDGRWRTLAEIEAVTGDPQASISAQLRHLRKPRFGEYTIDKRPRGDRAQGLFEYRLLDTDFQRTTR